MLASPTFLQELLDLGLLEKAAAGITKKVIAEGDDSLSEKQLYAFNTHVVDKFAKKCSRCGINIPWSEMSAAYDNSGKCSWCWNLTEKND